MTFEKLRDADEKHTPLDAKSTLSDKIIPTIFCNNTLSSTRKDPIVRQRTVYRQYKCVILSVHYSDIVNPNCCDDLS